MTNSVNSGYKRSWDGDHDDRKRRRSNEDSQPRDWRDVYLKSPPRKVPPSVPSIIDRRSSEGGRRRDEYRRSSDSGREKERERGRRDDRDRDHERDRDKGYRDQRRRSRSPVSRRNNCHLLPRHHQTATEKDNEEKEEGE